MFNHIGIILALIALVSWGLADFFIQKTARVVGSWKALFFTGVFGLVGLFPFIKNDLASLNVANLSLLVLVGMVVAFATLFDFEALKQGKIAIVEPIIGMELPIAVGLSVALAGESLTLLQIFLIGIIFIGIILSITTHHTHLHYHKRIFEKGVVLAGVGAISLAMSNFLVGVSSQDISPLMTIWFMQAFAVVACGSYIFYKNGIGSLIFDIKNHYKLIIKQGIFDNTAWISFAIATTFIPIAIAVTISESYIALAVLLGLLVNHERLKRHQLMGIIFATIGVISLSYFSS